MHLYIKSRRYFESKIIYAMERNCETNQRKNDYTDEMHDN